MTPLQIARKALVDMGIVVSDPRSGVAEIINFPENAPQDFLVRAQSHLAKFGRIVTLDLSDTNVADVTPLQGLTRLRELDLTGTQVSEKDLAKL